MQTVENEKRIDKEIEDIMEAERDGIEIGRDDFLTELRDSLALDGEEATITLIRRLLRERQIKHSR